MAKKHKSDWSSIREFVGEGVMLALPLCFPGQSVPPPAGETAMSVFDFDPAGTLYIGTTGARAHVLGAMIHQDTGIVHDLGVVPGADSVDGLSVRPEALCIVASGPGGSAVWRTERFGASFLIQEWGLQRNPIEKVCELFPDRRVAHAIPGSDSGTLLGIAEQTGELFRMELASGKVDVLGRVDDQGRFSRRLVLDRAGRLWGSHRWGQLWTCDPARGEIERTGLSIPAAAGRAQHTQVSAWALDPFTGTLYAGTSPDGFLFKLEPDSRELTPLGKPTRQDWITCLTVGNDGRLFGMAGAEDEIGHLFSYSPDSGALFDMGIPCSTLTLREYGYHFRCAATGAQGEMYFGQHERVNHLWVYFPAIPRCAKPAA